MATEYESDEILVNCVMEDISFACGGEFEVGRASDVDLAQYIDIRSLIATAGL